MQTNKIAYLIVAIGFSNTAQAGQYDALLRQLHLPDGFKISIYAENLPNARSLAVGTNGVVYVGTGRQGEGKVYAVQDKNADGVAESRYVLARNLNLPNGVAYKNGSLYVATIDKILRYDAITMQLAQPPEPVVVTDKFPTDAHHGWKYLRIGADNKLYTAVGAPCNICNPEKDIYGSLLRLNTDGSNMEILARGIRNTVGFDWQPDSNALFFNDNGRDYLGDDVPPDELNQWSAQGEHFGFPYCHAGDIPDPDLNAGKKCSEFKAPVWQYKAHIAPLGMRFYTGTQFPADYQKQLFVAQHGSWNRSVPQGYRVALIKFNGDKPIAEEDFISGWLGKEGEAFGRPVDIAQLGNGSLLISDDKLGVIYRVEYKAKP